MLSRVKDIFTFDVPARRLCEELPQSVAQDCQTLFHGLLRARECQAEVVHALQSIHEHMIDLLERQACTHVLNGALGRVVFRVRREHEHRAGHDDESAVQAMLKQLLHQLLAVRAPATSDRALASEPYVPLDVDAHPHKHASRGRARLRKPCWRHRARKQRQEVVAPTLVLPAQPAHPRVKPGEGPARGAEQLGDEDLAERVRVLRGGVGVGDEVRVEEGRGGDPAEAHARRDDLAEGVDAQHTSVDVEREEGRRQGARRSGRRGCGVLQEIVRVVLDDNEVVPLCERVDTLAPLHG